MPGGNKKVTFLLPPGIKGLESPRIITLSYLIMAQLIEAIIYSKKVFKLFRLSNL